MGALEIEVKFRIADPIVLRNRILAIGGKSKGCGNEYNILFDTPESRLRASCTLLRLRRSATNLLTVKTPPAVLDPEFKILRELETTVADFAAMRAALHALGFTKEQVYEKERETFTVGALELCLDRLPFGWFLELEGEKEDIRTTAAALGLSWQERHTASYRAIFEALKSHHHYDFSDITFTAFQKVPADLDAVLPTCRPVSGHKT